MASPTAFFIENSLDFIQHVLDHHIAPTTLIVCSTKDAFLEAVHIELESSPRRLWTTPTLRLLSTSSTVKLAFCPDVTHLRAYLATYSDVVCRRNPEPETALRLRGATPILAILNPLELHRPTSAFSAQGLNRTFGVAVDAAHATGSTLLIAECPQAAQPNPNAEQQSEESPALQPAENPWDEELSILNVTTKRLGEMSVGRTVKASRVAGRYFVFKKLPKYQDF